MLELIMGVLSECKSLDLEASRELEGNWKDAVLSLVRDGW